MGGARGRLVVGGRGRRLAGLTWDEESSGFRGDPVEVDGGDLPGGGGGSDGGGLFRGLDLEG